MTVEHPQLAASIKENKINLGVLQQIEISCDIYIDTSLSSNAETSTHNQIFFLGNTIVSMLITIRVLLNPVRLLDMKNNNKDEIYAFDV